MDVFTFKVPTAPIKTNMLKNIYLPFSLPCMAASSLRGGFTMSSNSLMVIFLELTALDPDEKDFLVSNSPTAIVDDRLCVLKSSIR